MKKLFYSALALLLVLPVVSVQAGSIAGGDPEGGELGGFLSNVLDFIDAVVIPFILAIGFLVFVWGMVQYFIIGGSNDDAKAKGKSLMLYALGGFVIILAFWGIVNIISGGIGLEGETLDNTPSVIPGSASNAAPYYPTGGSGSAL